MPQNRSPLTLIVDDELKELRRLERGFCDNTSVGVMAVDSLKQAADIIQSKRYHFSAILSDLRIEQSKVDPGRNLNSGIDLIRWISDNEPDIPIYVNSVDGDNKTIQQNINEMTRHPVRFFLKTRRNDPPWATIELDYLISAISQDESIRAKLVDSGVNIANVTETISYDRNIAEVVRDKLDAHRVMFLTSPTIADAKKGIKYIRPIECFCVKINNETVRAEVPSLGLLVAGEAGTVSQALEDLNEKIVREFEEYNFLNAGGFVGYAKKVSERLQEFIVKEQP